MIRTKPSLVLAQVQLALYTFVKDQADGLVPKEQIIWRNQSEPLPARPCVTLKITDGPNMVGSFDSLTHAEGDFFNLGGQRTMTVSIQVFGNTKVQRPMAYQLAVDLHASLSKLTVLEKLRVAGIGVQRRGDVTNITALEETEYEERAQFDILLGVAQNIVDEPGIITEADITQGIAGKPSRTIKVVAP